MTASVETIKASTQPLVPVFATKFASAWPAPDNGVRVELLPVEQAFSQAFASDAHLAAYTTTEPRRLNNAAVGRIPISMCLLIADLDDPIAHRLKQPARPEWRREIEAKQQRLQERHPRVYGYTTRGGYRLVFRLAAPYPIKSDGDRKSWRAVYTGFVRYLRQNFDLAIDRSCGDFGRLFRLPRVKRDGEWQKLSQLGDPSNIEAIDPSLFELPKPGNRYVDAAVRKALAAIKSAANGSRNEVLNREAFSLGGFVAAGHLDHDEIADRLLEAISANDGDPTKDAQKIEDALEAGMQQPRNPEEEAKHHHVNGVNGVHRPPPEAPGGTQHVGITNDHTDVRNAERLIDWYGDRLRYCATWHKWLVWDETRWVIDEAGRAQACAIETARRMLKEAIDVRVASLSDLEDAIEAKDDEARKEAEKAVGKAEGDIAHAAKSQNAGRLSCMLEVAQSDPRAAIQHTSLNSDELLLNVTNGTIDLRTGKLREHRREDLITKIVPVAYDPNAKAPEWERFLQRVMDTSETLIGFLQRMIGYSLTGSVGEHVLVFFYGSGANGKSTFLTTIHAMLGDYACSAPRGLLFRSRGDRHPTELAHIYGRRFVTCPEIEDGQAFDEGLVKDLVGGDQISARRMREDFWDFAPTHKLFLSGNHKPTVRGDDEGIWRRVRLVPWTVTIPEYERDKELHNKLLVELPGILRWAVDGCRMWQEQGLNTPRKVKEATDDYRVESDLIGQFFESRLKFNPQARITRSMLRAEYERWCTENGAEPVGAKRFSGRLRERGVTDVSVRVGVHVVDGWRGVRLKTDVERLTLTAYEARKMLVDRT